MDKQSDDSSQSSDSEPEEEIPEEGTSQMACDDSRKCCDSKNRTPIHHPAIKPSKSAEKKKIEMTDSDLLSNIGDPKKSKSSNEPLELKASFKNIVELKNELDKKKSLKHLILKNCSIETLNNEVLPPINTLNCIEFIKCDENIFKAFTKQENLQKIAVHNDDPVWNGFPHNIFNEICKNSTNLSHIVLNGSGTGSYFNCKEFPYKVTKLETTTITYHWYIGLTKPRLNFLNSQKGFLKELTIQELPYDLDGGDVLKYIIEMNLEKFYYGNIPLILKGKKQKIKEFTASEIQIKSAFEIIKQFGCDKFILKLSNTDISSEFVEQIINPSTNIFNSLKEFEVIDQSYGSFGVFTGLYKNINNIQKLTLRTKDRCINNILKELPEMDFLEEIQLSSTAKNALERYETIKKFAPNLKIIKVTDNSIEDAKDCFRDRVEVGLIDEGNDPSSANAQQVNEGVEQRENDGDDDDDDDSSDDDDSDGSEALDNDSHGTIEEKSGNFQFHTSLQNRDINDARKLYVHVFGYPKYIVININKRELKKFINEELNRQILFLSIEKGKFVVKFKDGQDELPNDFKITIENLAFRPQKMTFQLPLLTLSSNLRIKVYCCLKRFIDWNKFLPRITSRNGLSGSHWMYYDTVPINNQYQIWFYVDALDYALIEQKLHLLDFEGDQIEIKVDENPLRYDFDNLSM